MIISKINVRQDILILFLSWLLGCFPWLLGLHFIPWDSINQFYPQSYFVVESLLRGDLPWWNPYQFSGLPVFGDPQSLLFSLHTLVGVMLGNRYTLPVFDTVTLLHPLIGAFAIYGLGYNLKTQRAWVLLGALVFMLGGVTTSRLQHIPQIISYGWLPVLLWLMLMLVRQPTISRAVILGVIGAFWAVNANQVVFLGGLLLIGVAIYTLWCKQFPRRLLAMYCLSGIIILILIAPVYASILEVVGVSTRSILPIEVSGWSSFPAHVHLSLFLPGLYGNLSSLSWAPTDISQDYLYVGIIPLLFFGIALRSVSIWQKSLFWLWLAGFGFIILFSMGTRTPLYPFLYHYFPGFSLFRRPADGAYFVNLLLAIGLVIVGREVSSQQSGYVPQAKAQHWVGILIILVFILTLPVISAVLATSAQSKGALVVLYSSYREFVIRIFCLLGLSAWSFYLLKQTKAYTPLIVMSIAMIFTLDVSLAGRYTGKFAEPYSRHALAQTYRSATANSLDIWLQANTAPGSRVEVIGGLQTLGHSSKVKWYHSQGYNPIHLANYAQNLGAFELLAEPRSFPKSSQGPSDWRYDALGLRYIAFYRPLLEDRDINNISAVQARIYRDLLSQDGSTLVNSDIDQYEIWKRSDNNLWLSVAESQTIGDLSSAPCQLLQYGNTNIKLACKMKKPSTLVIGEVYAPGWMACINDQPTDIVPYFDVFRAIEVPAGNTVVNMTYQPVPFLRQENCKE